MIYRGHVIDKMVSVYQRNFTVRSKKQVHRFVTGELLLVLICIIDF